MNENSESNISKSLFSKSVIEKKNIEVSFSVNKEQKINGKRSNEDKSNRFFDERNIDDISENGLF